MFFFSFLLIRRPPRSTLFPYTSSSDLALSRLQASTRPPAIIMISGHGTIETAVRATKLGAFDFIEKPLRSEEHTSELQSHSDLVCRLLLEKKNRKFNSYGLPKP